MIRVPVTGVVAAIALSVIVVLAVANLATLLGVPAGHALVWMIPTAYLLAAVCGTAWGLILKAHRPDVYATIGLGAKAVTGRLDSPVPGRSLAGRPSWAVGERTGR